MSKKHTTVTQQDRLIRRMREEIAHLRSETMAQADRIAVLTQQRNAAIDDEMSAMGEP